MTDRALKMQLAAEMWGRGVSSTLIAKRIGIPRNTVVSYARRNRDLFPRRRGSAEVAALYADRIRRLEALWVAGFTYRQMADEIGCENVGRIIAANRDRFPPRGGVKECRQKRTQTENLQRREAA